jgi:peptidoglycan-associated lipoprotein
MHSEFLKAAAAYELLKILRRSIIFVKLRRLILSKEEKMKHLFIAVLIVLGIIAITGCAHKEVTQVPEQPQVTPAPAPKAEAPKEMVPEAPVVTQQPEVTQAERELNTQIEDIHFDFDKSDIKDNAKPILKNLSGTLSANTKTNVVIEGNCDERGTSEYNLALGDRRANAAKSYLVSLGVPSTRIKTISYGKEKPLCTESTEECWAKNRRDHFVLTEAK